jgi:signal transduction histidine kinase
VSLLLSGVLTWVLVRNLEEQTTKDNLERTALYSALNVGQWSHGARTPLELASLLASNTNQAALAGDRLIVLQRQSTRVLFDSGDSGGELPYGYLMPITIPNTQLAAGNAVIGSTNYVYGYAHPAQSSYVVLVLRPQDVVSAQAESELLPNLLKAGGISLVIAILLALLVSRAMTRPLTELAAASEDIARGNYASRVEFTGGDEIGIVGQAFNRMAEAVERARQAQREFLANVSHELKTPLTSLIGFSQALVDGSLASPEEHHRAATIVHEESERMLRMAQELLDLARVEAGQVSITVQPVDLVAMLHQELDLVRKRAEERRLRLSLEVSPTVPPALADPERLHQILDNLLDNAVKYAPAGTQVVIGMLPMGSDRLELHVSNPVGTQIDPQRIFERFYRADPSRSSAAGGVGLGLAISQQLADRMSGRLWADFNREGWLRLRLELPSAGTGAALDSAVPSIARPGQRTVGDTAFSSREWPSGPTRR